MNRIVASVQPSSFFQLNRRHLLLFAVAAVAVYVLLPQLGDFSSSWHLLSKPDPSFTALAVLLTFGTYAAGTGTYRFLAFKHLRFGRTLLVQLAAMFVNRLLPAGVGALGANFLYLRHERHKTAQAVSVVGINNLLGFTGHGILVLLTLAFFPGTSKVQTDKFTLNGTLLLEVTGVLVLMLVIAGAIFGRHKLVRALKDIRKQLASYRSRPSALIAAQGMSILLTLCNVLCLLSCAHALDIHLSFAAILLIFTFGVGAGAAVPTPGGLGGFEAGLAAGFVAYGIDPSRALAAALLYRLISYWLTMAAGLVAFIVCQKQGLFSAPAK
jgi:glycosyltransferase 2 family protein